MTTPQYPLHMMFNKEDYAKFLSIVKKLNLPKAQIVRLALFEPERYQELLTRSQSVNRKGE